MDFGTAIQRPAPIKQIDLNKLAIELANQLNQFNRSNQSTFLVKFQELEKDDAPDKQKTHQYEPKGE